MRPTLTENSYIAPRCIDCYISGCGGTASCDAFGCQSRIRIENLLRHVVIIVQCISRGRAREEIPCGGIVFHRSGNGTVADSNIYVQRRYIGSFRLSGSKRFVITSRHRPPSTGRSAVTKESIITFHIHFYWDLQ